VVDFLKETEEVVIFGTQFASRRISVAIFFLFSKDVSTYPSATELLFQGLMFI
jgi:hypothetical protein